MKKFCWFLIAIFYSQFVFGAPVSPVVTGEAQQELQEQMRGENAPARNVPEPPAQSPRPQQIQSQALPAQEQLPEVIEPASLAKSKIIVGDILRIQTAVKEYLILVNKDGATELPLLGHQKVSGKTMGDIEEIYKGKMIVVKVNIASIPQGLPGISLLAPKGVVCLGEFNRQSVVTPGTLMECVGNSFGLTSSADGTIIVYKRDQKLEISYSDYLAGKYDKNITCEAGTVIFAEKSAGARFLDGIGPTLSKLRDIALVGIAVVELSNYGKTEGWW